MYKYFVFLFTAFIYIALIGIKIIPFLFKYFIYNRIQTFETYDIYYPKDLINHKGCIIIVPGGGWIVNHKLNNMPLAISLMEQGYIVISTTFKTWPFYKFEDMCDEVDKTIDMVIEKFKGDKIHICSTSAGSHTVLSLIVKKINKQIINNSNSSNIDTAFNKLKKNDVLNMSDTNWTICDISTIVNISGIYSDDNIKDVFKRFLIGFIPQKYHSNRNSCVLSEFYKSIDLYHSIFSSPSQKLPNMCIVYGLHDLREIIDDNNKLFNFCSLKKYNDVLKISLLICDNDNHTSVVLDRPLNNDNTITIKLLKLFEGETFIEINHSNIKGLLGNLIKNNNPLEYLRK